MADGGEDRRHTKREAIPTGKGEETAALRAAIDQALSKLAADGTLSALLEQYFGTDITQN